MSSVSQFVTQDIKNLKSPSPSWDNPDDIIMAGCFSDYKKLSLFSSKLIFTCEVCGMRL